MSRRNNPGHDRTFNARAYRAVATWTSRSRPTVFDHSDRARVRAQGRKWHAAGARVELQRHVGYGQWKTERTLTTPQPDREAPATVPDELAQYERLMRQAPGAPGRHRGRISCRHVAGGKGIR